MWKPVVGYEGLYEVSSEGAIASLKNKRRHLRQFENGFGYMIVKLYKDGKPKSHKVHRLVARAFIPNKNGMTQVNHKDGDRTNNNVENLEWSNNSLNQKHSVYVLKTSYLGRNPIPVRDKATRKEYRSISEASRECLISKSSICGDLARNNKRWERVLA